MSFNAICENKILAEIFEITVLWTQILIIAHSSLEYSHEMYFQTEIMRIVIVFMETDLPF